MLFRKKSIDLKNWLNSSKNAILITGARQSGKTFLVRNILREENADFVELNLLRQPELVSLFDSAKKGDPQEFLTRLSLATSKKLTRGKTIIFLDEIQEYKDILTVIKFLVEDGSFRYVLSGSLLGVELTDLRSAPVGYLSVIDMYPMDFEEFITALNMPASAIENLHHCFDLFFFSAPHTYQGLFDFCSIVFKQRQMIVAGG